MVLGVSVCGSIRRMDSSISSSNHSIKDTARQRRPVQMGVSVCLHVAAFVVWTVVSVGAAKVSRTPREPKVVPGVSVIMWQHSSYGR